MDPFAVSHFSDNALLHDLRSLVARDCRTTALLLTRIAEVDERKLYRRAGYPCMRDYCLHELHFSEGAAYKRINAARTARQFSAVLLAVADGRLHLSAVVTLAGHLTSGNADELVTEATHRTRGEIEALLARRFPRPDLPERLQSIPSPPWSASPTAPQQADPLSPGTVDASSIPPGQPPEGHLCQPSPENVATSALHSWMTPLAPERFGLQVTIDQETHHLLQQAQDLMSHEMPAGGIAPVLKRALKLLVEHLEKRKFAATGRPGHARPTTSARHIPAAVKRAVRKRDGDRCTYMSDCGRRCPARRMLEFDHREPMARGGESTAENLRLRCRAHNAYAAECAFGAGFMERKRTEAQTRTAARKHAKARDAAAGPAKTAGKTLEPCGVYVGAP